MSAPEPEADGFRRYGAWAGCPQGRVEDTSRCVEEVWPNERGSIPHQCWRKRGHGPGGLYCKQHDPAAVRRRDEERSARYEAQMERMHEAREAPIREAYLSGVRAGLEAAEDWLRGRGHHDLAASLSMGAKELADLIAEVRFMSAEPIAKEAADAAE